MRRIVIAAIFALGSASAAAAETLFPQKPGRGAQGAGSSPSPGPAPVEAEAPLIGRVGESAKGAHAAADGEPGEVGYAAPRRRGAKRGEEASPPHAND